MSVRLSTKWLWVQIPLLSLRFLIWCLFWARSSLTFRQLRVWIYYETHTWHTVKVKNLENWEVLKKDHCTKNEVYIKDYFSKRLLRIWSHLLKKSLMENFIFCSVNFRSSNGVAYLGTCQWSVREPLSRKTQSYPSGNYMLQVNNRNKFKVNSKDTRRTPLASFRCLYC